MAVRGSGFGRAGKPAPSGCPHAAIVPRLGRPGREPTRSPPYSDPGFEGSVRRLTLYTHECSAFAVAWRLWLPHQCSEPGPRHWRGRATSAIPGRRYEHVRTAPAGRLTGELTGVFNGFTG